MNFIPPQDEGRLRAAASGVLPNGKPIVVNADGTVSVVATSSVSQSVGTPAVFESAAINGVRSAYDSNSNRVVIEYKDVGNSNYGTCVVGTVNPANNSVSFGTPVVFESNTVSNNNSVVFDSNSNKVVVFYESSDGKAKVGTVDPSDNSITFGSSTQFDNNTPNFIASTFDSNSNKVVVAFRDTGQSNAAVARVGTVSGTSISFGTQATVSAGSNTGGDHIGCAFDSTSNKIVFAYRHVGNSNRGTAVVGNISGTNLAFGTPVVFNSGGSTQYCSVAYDSIANKSVIVYSDQTNSNYGTVIVATVSGTSISFGSAVVFTSNFALFTNDNGIAYDTSAGKVVIAYRNIGNSNYGTAISGTVSGTSISFDSPLVFKTALVNNVSTVYDSTSERILIGYRDDTNSNYGTGIVYRTGGSSTNFTATNYVGMSGGPVDFDEGAAAVGSAVVFETGAVDFCSAEFDSSSNKVVVVYRDGGNSSSGTAVIGTVSGTSITFGTPVVYRSGANTPYNDVVFDSNSNKVVVVYTDYGNSGRGAARVGTVSGTTISFGTEVVFEAGAAGYNSIAFDSNLNKVVIAYQDGGDSNKGKAIVGTISGTDISFGTAAEFEAGGTLYVACVYDENAQKFLIAYRDAGNNDYATAVVGTVSGTNISFGTPVVIESAVSYPASPGGLAYDQIAQKSVLLYYSGSSGKVVVGTISGTNVSFGTAVSFSSNTGLANSLVYDSAAKVVVLVYRDGANSNYGTFKTGSVSGTSITVSAATVFEAASSASIAAAFDSNSKKVVAIFEDKGNSNYGTATVIQVPYDNTVRGQVASGSSASVDIIGTVSTNQTGLTPGQSYFVQTDGTLALTAGTPSVFAGTAISATKLLVKT